MHIQFGVDVCIAQVAYEVGDEGKWVLIMHGEGVDFLIILYQS